jgi:hypothetical protein
MRAVLFYVIFAIFVCTPTASALGLGLLAMRLVRPEAFASATARFLKRAFVVALLVAASGFALTALLGTSLAVK